MQTAGPPRPQFQMIPGPPRPAMPGPPGPHMMAGPPRPQMNGVDNNNPQVGMGMSAPPFRHAGPPQPPMGGQVRPLGPPIPGQMPGGQQMRPMGPPMPGQMPGGQQMPPMQGGQMPPMPGGQMPARPPGMPGAPPGGFPSHSQPVARPNTQTIYPDQKPSQNQVVQEANGGHFDTNGAPSPHITTDFGNAGPRMNGVNNTNPPVGMGMSAPTFRPGPPQPPRQGISGQMPPMGVQMPPMGSQMPPMAGQMPPMGGPIPPMGGQMPPPVRGQMPPMGGQMPPMGSQMPPLGGQMPPMPGQMPGGQHMPPMQGGQMPPMSAGQMPPMSGGHPMPGSQMPPMAGGQMPFRPGMPGAPPGGQQMPPMQGSQMPPMPGGQMPPRPAMLGAQPGGYPTQPQSVASPNRRTLDPDQMPSPIQVMEEDQKANGGYFDTREKGAPPPLITTDFVVRDFGNASPRFIRSTMYYVPSTEEMRKQTGVPFGLVISPMAQVGDNEIEPPVTDFGPSGPVRCIRCKAYMCSMMQFIDGGRRFQCMFCKATTEVPAEYFQHLDHNGQRVDHYQRPELCLGTYECVATKDYCRENIEPKVPAVLFAIDVSYPMIKEGIVQLICSNMKEMLKHLPRDMNCDKEQMRVGFMTYDSKINFYNIKGALTQPQQMTVGDVNDMFVPLVDGFMVTVEESETVIDSLMEQIPQMFADTRETETVLGPVIQAGKEAFKAANCAGKLIVFHHNLPVAEAPGKLKNRDDRKVLGTEKEKTVLTPQSKTYNEFGQECVSVGCTVDLFLFNNAYVDVATLSQVCRLSGGQLYKYTYFQPDLDGERFLADLRHNLSRPVAFDAIMRVRTSTGVRPVEFFGSFYMANTTDTELASVNSDMAIACEIKYDDKLTEEDGVYIQAAILFTSCSGQRRLRVINLALNTGSSMAEMYRNCELDTLINFTAKQSISRLMETNPKTVKETLIANCAQILACYRKNCASPSSAGQLILPECMKLLPLYTNCLLKSDALSGGADVGCDDRAYLMSALSSMDVVTSVAFFYPRLIPIHTLEDDDFPRPIRCTMDKISDDGVYLLENGLYLFMYIGLATDPSWIQDVFGVQTAAQIDIDKTRLVDRDTPASKRVRAIIDAIRGQRPRHFMRLVLVRSRDKLDILFRHYLCEDRAAPGSSGGGTDNFSYVDFLCHMHKEIRALLG